MRSLTVPPNLERTLDKLSDDHLSNSQRAYIQAAYLLTLAARVAVILIGLAVVNLTMQQFTQPSERDVQIACLNNGGQIIESQCIPR